MAADGRIYVFGRVVMQHFGMNFGLMQHLGMNFGLMNLITDRTMVD